jgi:hypothetical protein
MRELLFFNSMVTTRVITVVYWLLLLIVAVFGLGIMFRSAYGFMGYLSNLITGLGVIGIGGLSVRIWCELLIVLFKIHDNIQAMAERHKD